jgi:hypothetical protein
MNFPNKPQLVKSAQKSLNIKEDGLAGKVTWAAIFDFFGADSISGVQKFLGLTADGIDGPRTWQGIVDKLGNDQPSNLFSNKWPNQNYSELVKFYGEIRTNQTTLILPYEMRLAWDLSTKVSKISCNVKVKDSLERIFQKTLAHYGLEKIKELRLDIFGGCLNVRKMRGGSSWSMHSWGIAVDLDPDNNQLKWGKDKASFAKPEYDAFWKIIEDEGWTSLGRKKNYDWMHFQAANI